MTIAKDFAAKAFVAFVAAAMMISLFAPAAKAQTAEELQTQINDLMAQIATLQAQVGQGGTSASGVCPYTWTRDLNMGATGADVMKLQQFLNANADTRVSVSGAGSVGAETEYYGALTGAAVAKFQVMYRAEILTPLGMVNPSTYFGPSTRAKANSVCVTAPVIDPVDPGTPTPTPIGELEGGAGSINDVNYISKLSNEEVGEAVEDAEVAGLEIEADSGSDIELTAVNLNFSKGTAGSNFDKYAEEVSVWVDGEEVARVDADEFTKSNNYDKTVSLDAGGIIRAGEIGDLVVKVSGISNLDSTDATDTWTLEFESVRFRDAQGASVTDTETGVINDTAGRTFSFESFATAADLELKITSGDDSINDAHVIVVDDTNDTDGVELFSFNLEAEGDSDIVIDGLPINFTSVGAGVGEIVNTAEIWADGELIGSESVSTTTATTREIVFDNLDWTISAGDKVAIVIKVDVNDTDGGFGEGATLAAVFGETETDDTDFDAVDSEGNDLADGDKTGSASGDAQLFYTIAPEVEVLSTTISPIDNGTAAAESALAKTQLKITARGGTLYLNGDNETTEANRFFKTAVYGSGTSASTTASTTTYTINAGTNDVTNSGANDEYYTLDEGESMTITVESIVTQATVTSTAVLAGVKAEAIQFGTAATSATTRSAYSFTYTDLLDATQSGTASLVNPA